MTTPTFPPLLAPGEWWRLYLGARLSGDSDSAAIASANKKSGLKSRQWMRFKISGDTILSLPVKGGASALKNRFPSGWELSDEAGRAARKINSTLATVYGRYPFFPFLHDDLSAAPAGRAEDVCMSAFEAVKRILGIDDAELLKALKTKIDSHDTLLPEIAKEAKTNFNPELSVIDIIFRSGPDAIFALIEPF